MLICQRLKHLRGVVYFIVTFMCCLCAYAQSEQLGREPANFVPDDDMIIVPMVVEKNFIDEFNDKHERDFRRARQKLERWMSQEQYARDYGLEDVPYIQLPNAAQKERFFMRNYLRFIKRDVDRSNQEMAQNIVQGWTTDDEIDSIKANEQRDDFIVKAKRNNGQRVYQATKKVKVGGQEFDLDIQPRIEMGMVKVRLDTPYFKMRGWLGVNGDQEINIKRRFAATNTNAMVNYYIEQNRVLGVIDQPLFSYTSFRFTHDKVSRDFDSLSQTGLRENNSFQVRFYMGF